MAASSLQHFGKGTLRVVKNYTKGYSDVQTKVRDATSNDPWGPSGTQMNELAQMTYSQNEFVEIMEMLDKRLNDKGKNWRHVFKALTLLDYCLHAGSENVVIYFKDNIYIIKTLKEFVYVDEDGKDVGANVRQKAKDITNLLQDEERLRNERRSRGAMRDRMLGNIANSGLKGDPDSAPPPPRGGSAEGSRYKPTRSTNEDDDLKRALEESRKMQDDEQIRRSQVSKEEEDFARAMRLSEEEEAKRKRELEEANARALFDDNQQVQPPQPQLIDAGWGQQLQPQYTSFNPFQQQMMMQQQQAMMAQQQQEEYMRQQMMVAEEQRRQQEWMVMQQQQAMMQQQQQQLMAQPTGYRSNNPFGPSAPQPTGNFQLPTPAPEPVPPMPSLFPASPAPPSPQPQAQAKPAFIPPVKKDDGANSHLAQLLANRDGGMDTFGNVGAMRFPVGSPFHQSNRNAVAQSGQPLGANNPFGRPQNGQQQNGGAPEQPFFSI